MIVVADNLRITLPVIRDGLKQQDARPLAQMAVACRDAGAQAIDINCGPLSRHPERQMRFLVNAVQAAVNLPLVLDTTNPDALEAGLAACDRRAVINGVSLEDEKLKRILPLARQHNADIIGYLLHPNGQVPADADGRMEAAVQLFTECQQAGIKPHQLIMDPIVAPLSWQDGNAQNMAVLEVLGSLPELLGVSVRTIAGLSNLTSGAPSADARRHYQGAFLPMLAAAGVDMILMNALDPGLMRIVGVCRSITGKRVFSWQ
ncbi:MAG: dihydropteroate synthase [Desulfosarcina sp.]|jgi:5-methyltetrahydrofolate corrinoid/iron sulfur protein methyltransferase